jgi:hypothetical protein
MSSNVLIGAQKLERLVKARFGAGHPYYAVALKKLGAVSSQSSVVIWSPRLRRYAAAKPFFVCVPQ